MPTPLDGRKSSYPIGLLRFATSHLVWEKRGLIAPGLTGYDEAVKMRLGPKCLESGVQFSQQRCGKNRLVWDSIIDAQKNDCETMSNLGLVAATVATNTVVISISTTIVAFLPPFLPSSPPL